MDLNPDSTLLVGRPGALRTMVAYLAMIAATVLAFLWIRGEGESLVDQGRGAVAVAEAAALAEPSVLARVLLAMAVITACARLSGLAFQHLLAQPPVMGEIVAGLLLGPSVLGALVPGACEWLLPASAAPSLGIVAKLGVVLFMFLVGLEFDVRLLRGSTHATLAVAHASIAFPFVLGAALALVLYPLYSNAGVDFTVFALFLGVSMSVTAFPVLARILTDRKMQGTRLGVTALACAAVGDASAWCLLAFVSGVARARLDGAWLTLGLVVAFVVAMALVVRPLAARFAAREETRTGDVSATSLAAIFVLLLLSAAATEAMGIHALFGAFLFGAAMPHEGRLAAQVRVRLEDVVVVLLLPLFFAFTGMRTELSLLHTQDDWAFAGLCIVVATIGKILGTSVAARAAGMGGRDAGALGVLMNTRGLMELIVLNVGLEMGVLSPSLFAMLVLMALVTTFMTTPLLALVMPRARRA